MLLRERLLHHIQAPLRIAVAQERPPVAVGETAVALQPGADNTPTHAQSPMAYLVSQLPTTLTPQAPRWVRYGAARRR
jgi:hypothetical protein